MRLSAWMAGVCGIGLAASAFAADTKTGVLCFLDPEGENLTQLVQMDEFPICGSSDLSPDGTRVALDGWKHGQNVSNAHALIVDLADASVIDLGPGLMPNWSPDGQWFAYSRYSPAQGVWLRSADGAQERLIDGEGWGIQWSPNGRYLAYTLRGQDLVVHDLYSGSRTPVFPQGTNPYQHIRWNFAWSHDSKRIAFMGLRGESQRELSIVHIGADDPQLKVCWSGATYGNEFAWSPDGKSFCTTGPEGLLYRFPAQENATPEKIPGQPLASSNRGPCWSRDGKRFLFIADAEALR